MALYKCCIIIIIIINVYRKLSRRRRPAAASTQQTPEIRIDEPLNNDLSQRVKDELSEVKDESEDGYASDSTTDSELEFADDTELDTPRPSPSSPLQGTGITHQPPPISALKPRSHCDGANVDRLTSTATVV